MAVAEPEVKPAWTRRPWVLAACDAIIFLHYGLLWVATAACLVRVAGRRVFGQVEGSPLLSAASSVVQYSLTYGVSIHLVAAMLICARGARPVPTKDRKKKDIKDDPLRPVVRPVVIGGLVLIAFMVLIAAADYVVGRSYLEGSQREWDGAILRDLVPMAVATAQYFIILPTTAPRSGG